MSLCISESGKEHRMYKHEIFVEKPVVENFANKASPFHVPLLYHVSNILPFPRPSPMDHNVALGLSCPLSCSFLVMSRGHNGPYYRINWFITPGVIGKIKV